MKPVPSNRIEPQVVQPPRIAPQSAQVRYAPNNLEKERQERQEKYEKEKKDKEDRHRAMIDDIR